jgi:hypothetical protein
VIERENKIRMEGGFVTAALRMAFADGGLPAARDLVEDGLDDEQIIAICEHRAHIEGSSTTELVFVEAVEPGYEIARKPAPRRKRVRR